MKNFNLKKIIAVVSCTLLSVLFILILFFCTPKIQALPESDRTVEYILSGRDENGKYTSERITAVAGKDFTAISIADLGKLNKITKANYVADEFIKTGLLSPDIQIVDLEKPFEFAEKGTLIFVILSLDPLAQDFFEQSERLSQYKIGDDWRFTMSLPKIFGASNVYSGSSLVARHGDIENYDFAEFNDNYDVKTDKFSSMAESTTIDLSFYTKQITMADAITSAKIITIHYQSTGNAYSGIMDCPLIGTESAVKSINEQSQNLVSTFGIVAVMVFAVLTVLSFVEQSKKFISAIVWIFGIAIMLLSHLFLSRATNIPLFWSALSLAMPFIILGGAQLAIGRNFGKIPTKYIFSALSVIGALLAFLCPFISFNTAGGIMIVCTVIKSIGAVVLLTFIGLALLSKSDKNNILQMVCTTLITVAIIASLFISQIFPVQTNPLFWLCVVVTVSTFISCIVVIREMKKSNVYLTTNLHKEVERQVKDIKAIIAERDNLLQFVSHDMKKPLSSAVLLCDTAIEREKDDEQIKTIGIIKQDTERVINHLSEIAVYAKLNYLAEPSQVVDMLELCALLYKYHKFDCDANGIILNNMIDTPIKAFVKPKGIENVVSNIIINAIEHANCTTITLSIKAEKNKVILCISDDGKGIDQNLDVFAPYISENDTETGGIGLYICKNIIESMNGELTYNSSDSGTIFYISLLKA